MFVLALLLKIAMTAGIVVAASVVVERSGPFVGSLIASVPTAGGAAMIILAMEHPTSFIAASAVGGIVSNAVGAVFAVAYAALAQRKSLAVSLGGAFLVWFAVASLTRFVDWTATSAMLLSVAMFPLAIVAGTRYRAVTTAKGKVHLTVRDLAGRASVVTACVLVVTALSATIGSFASGLFAFFPVAMSSYFLILHPRIGGPAAASVAAHVPAPLFGLVVSLLAVHLLAEPIGVWWSYLVGLSVGFGWNAMLWLLRNRRDKS
jgi:hypothetical protein